MMLKITKAETIARIDLFSDSKVIAGQLANIADMLKEIYGDGFDTYWLSEAEAHIVGIHDLVLEMCKILKQEEAEEHYAIQEPEGQTEAKE
jgi:hypothetical protein|tara:strand:- start:148 stop:420 length:273 start_codon:yes stop_codon:yes gene_type:complete